jgi:hypothetical protein
MITFEVAMNRQRVCRAGVGKAGVLSAIVTWVGGSPRAPRRGGRTRKGESWLNVGGLRHPRRGIHNHVTWANRVLAPGDEITIRVLEARRVDRPRSSRIRRAPNVEMQQRAQYRALKAKFEPRDRNLGKARGSLA